MAEAKEVPMVVLPAGILIGLIMCCWIARAPTSYTGKLPFGGDNFPIDLNSIYFIIFGPIIGMLAVASMWILFANDWGTRRSSLLLMNFRNESWLLAALFALIFIAETFLSIQYFLILAPKSLCATRPNFDLLWRNFKTEQITHCMSKTEAINDKAPYYFGPQVFQAWGHIIWPIVTLICLIGAWHSWSLATAGR